MAKMVRTDDVAVVLHQVSVASAAVAARFVVPRDMKLVKAFASKNAAYGAAPVLTFASASGDLTDTLTIPTAGAAGDIVSQDMREEANNAFAEGSECTVTVATPSAGDTANLTLVFRPL